MDQSNFVDLVDSSSETAPALPDHVSFKNRADLATKFKTIKNKGKGDCLFYSIGHLLGGIDHLDLRQQVCDFYAELYDGIEDDGTSEPYVLPKFRGLVKRYDRGMPDDPDIDNILLSFTNKNEMQDEREIEIEPEPGQKKKRKPEIETIQVPHYRSICEQGEYASALDIFIMSLLLNVDIYTFVIVQGRIEFYEASYRTAPTNAFFLLQSGGAFGHYEALVPKCEDGLFRDIPANMPRDITRLQRLWPALFEKAAKAPKKAAKTPKKAAKTPKKAAKKAAKAPARSSSSSGFEAYDPALFESSLPESYDPADFDSSLPEGYDPADFESPPDKKTKKNRNHDRRGGRPARRTRGARRLSGLSVHARSRRLSRR